MALLGAVRTGDEVRPWALQRVVRFRDVLRARGLEVAVVARQLTFPTRPGWEREAEVQRNELVSMLTRMAFGWLAFMDAA
jgi:hypothetical protein